MRSYVPATHERDGVAPRSRSCAPGQKDDDNTANDSGEAWDAKIKKLNDKAVNNLSGTWNKLKNLNDNAAHNLWNLKHKTPKNWTIT